MREPVLENLMWRVLQQMFEKGGDFVKLLARCYARADEENAKRLRRAFPEIFEKYDAMVPK